MVNDVRKEYHALFKQKAWQIIDANKFHVTVGAKNVLRDYDEMTALEKEEVGNGKEWHASGVHLVYTLFTHRNSGLHLVYTFALDNKC